MTWGTGLNGASDVTLTGAGSFAPDRPGIQGIPTGKWTVNATGGADLRNAAGFAGGLSLGENAAATLDIAGTSLVEFVAWTRTSTARRRRSGTGKTETAPASTTSASST